MRSNLDLDNRISELEALFARGRHLRALYRMAQAEIAAALVRQVQGKGRGPTEDEFDELAFYMARSESADARYLELLGHVADQVIANARSRR
jgi:hypothetical protein